MCEWGTTTDVVVKVPADLSATGEARMRVKAIDSCIAPLVEALSQQDIGTRASCCGHGKRPGNIVLEDGRELMILPDFDTARYVERLIPVTIGGEMWLTPITEPENPVITREKLERLSIDDAMKCAAAFFSLALWKQHEASKPSATNPPAAPTKSAVGAPSHD